RRRGTRRTELASYGVRYCHGEPRPLHSFPTRRSSDLRYRKGDGPPYHLLFSRRGFTRELEARARRDSRVVLLGPKQLLGDGVRQDRKSTRLNSSHVKISYAVFCLKKNKYTCERQRNQR